jgi:hypothetical protein
MYTNNVKVRGCSTVSMFVTNMQPPHKKGLLFILVSGIRRMPVSSNKTWLDLRFADVNSKRVVLL